jgi:SAM-dependent methyltransferase
MIYERLAAYYDNFVDETLVDIYVDEILKHNKSGNVADLGCGTGPLSIKLAKLGFDVTATDISERMLEIAYNNSVNEEVHVNFSKHNILDPLSNTYDIFTMVSDVINYLADKTQMTLAFKNVEEVMKEDSIFIFDFLKLDYMYKVDGYEETMDINGSTINWKVNKHIGTSQISHKVTINDQTEIHTQITYSEEEYKKILSICKIEIFNTIYLEERIIFVCKKRIMS